MPKRLVLCCDGTWNTADQQRSGRSCPTNVTKVALGIADEDAAGVGQRVHYQRGIGTTPVERLPGGVAALGLSRNVREAYRFVVEHYEPGDELFFFGFSRGAYTARSTVGLIHNCGVLRREHAGRLRAAFALYRSRAIRPCALESRLFRRSYSHPARIRFLGVWDTVGAVGIPTAGRRLAALADRHWGFHDTRLSRTVDAAYQALAIDEQRRAFEPAVWRLEPDAGDQEVEQVWFSGAHSDVGGGYPDSGLADIALLWMVDRARRHGLAFRDDAFAHPARGGPRTHDGRTFPVEPDPRGRLHRSREWVFRLQVPHDRPIGARCAATETVADTALARHADAGLGYAPKELVTYLRGTPRTTGVRVDWPPAAASPARGPGRPGSAAAAAPGGLRVVRARGGPAVADHGVHLARADAGRALTVARTDSPFTIEVRFLGGLSDAQRGAFVAAADRWARVVVGDLPDVLVDGEVVDDLLILAQGVPLDGPGAVLGQAGPTHLRPASAGGAAFLPVKGVMSFDTADLAQLEADGTLYDVIAHEMGHVLGLGTVWVLKELLAGGGTADPTFVGPGAMGEFGVLLGGTGPQPVPVENTGGPGTRDSHWRETVFGTELMTGFVGRGGNPLSRMTAASLGDLGYQVDRDAADAYELPDLLARAVRGELVAHTAPVGAGIVLPSIPIVLPDDSLRTGSRG